MDNLPLIIFIIVILYIFLSGKRNRYPAPLPKADKNGMVECRKCGSQFKLLNKEYYECLCADCWHEQRYPELRTKQLNP